MSTATPAESRTAELVGALSLATDASAGFPAETAIRTAILAVRLGRAVGLSGQALADAYYAGLTRFLGCVGYAHEEATLNGGDDMGFLATYADVDLGDPVRMVGRTLARLGRGRGVVERAGAVARFLADPRGGDKVSRAHCSTAVKLAARLGMTEGVTRALDQMYERWDGRGAPRRLAGDAIDPVARVLHVAHVAEVYHRLGGAPAAAGEIRRRRVRHFEPAVVSRFVADAPALLRGLDAPSLWDLLLEEEPAPARRIHAADLPVLALAFAQFADLKSVYTLGHSTGVAALAAAVADGTGLSGPDRELLTTAALVHDVGRVAVANGIWDKPGPLNAAEWDRVRSHSAETERVLGRAEILRPLIDVAGCAHERLDGSGYHRRLPAAGVGRLARLLAACDAYAAMLEERAHRPARTRAEAARLIGEEVRAGRLDREAARAVLEAAGHRPSSLRRELPDGLSEREAEVLYLLARGLTNKEIGGRLHVSARTVQTHVMHIFEKTGIRGRAAAALYAVDHGLVKNQPSGG